MLEINKIHNGNCLELMRSIPDKSIDLICCDLPYGTTKCKWDNIIPFDVLWEQYNRIIKDNGAIVLFGSEPFSSLLRSSNLKHYKYDWYWKKSKANGFLNVKKMPLKDIETISVFYKKQPIYNPQGVIKVNKIAKNPKGKLNNTTHVSGHNGGALKNETFIQEYSNYPKQVLEFSHVARPIHPTQKPVELFEYLIKTYSNEGDVILDNCSGSGTTAIACLNINRNFICIEQDQEYYMKSVERMKIHNESIK